MTRYSNWIVAFITEIRQRLPSNFKMLKHMFMFSIHESLMPSDSRPNIGPLGKVFGYNNDKISKIELQWNNLRNIPWKATTTEKL